MLGFGRLGANPNGIYMKHSFRLMPSLGASANNRGIGCKARPVRVTAALRPP